MSACRTALRVLATTDIEPRDLVSSLDDRISSDINSGQMITMLYGRLDGEGGFVYCNAGHGPALAYSGGEVKTLKSHRFPLGLHIPLDQQRELQSKLHLDPGDRLLLASDGVSEAENETGQFFSEQQIRAILSRDSASCEDVVKDLVHAIESHVGSGIRTDDVTILCIERVVPD